jgi:hypothetical protein
MDNVINIKSLLITFGDSSAFLKPKSESYEGVFYNQFFIDLPAATAEEASCSKCFLVREVGGVKIGILGVGIEVCHCMLIVAACQSGAVGGKICSASCFLSLCCYTASTHCEWGEYNCQPFLQLG